MPVNEDEKEVAPSLTLTTSRSNGLGGTITMMINYTIEGMGKVESKMFTLNKRNGSGTWIKYTDFTVDTVKNAITVDDNGVYQVIIKNKTNETVSAEIEVNGVPVVPWDPVLPPGGDIPVIAK